MIPTCRRQAEHSLQDTEEENARHGELLPNGHLQPPDEGNWNRQDDEVDEEIRDGQGVVSLDLFDAGEAWRVWAHLRVHLDGRADEEQCEKEADPPDRGQGDGDPADDGKDSAAEDSSVKV